MELYGNNDLEKTNLNGNNSDYQNNYRNVPKVSETNKNSEEIETVDFGDLFTNASKGFDVSNQDLLSVQHINDEPIIQETEIL